ncbi:MAG: TRAP transporter small permease [Chloroflexi bacterium]|nr:TRAP transporter small permease [Chloroflexota bacterium]
MRKLIQAIEAISKVGGYFSGALVFILMLLIMYEVFTRFVISKPAGYADEISGYLFLAIGFIALAYTWQQRGHVRVEALVTRLPRRVARWIRLATLVIALAFVGLSTQVAYAFLVDIYKRQLVSMTQLRIFLLWPLIPLGVGFALLLLQIIAEFVRAIGAIKEGKGEEAI